MTESKGNSDNKEIFTHIYATNGWGKGGGGRKILLRQWFS